MRLFRKTMASLLIASTALLGLPMGAHAALVSTEEALSPQLADTQRAAVNAFLARSEVRDALKAQGLNPESAAQRVAAMNDAEIAQLAGRVEQAPAGGDILGVAFTIFIILLITDILGLTKVFPFTRSVR